MSRIIEKAPSVQFQLQEGVVGIPGSFSVEDDGRIEIVDRECRVWRCALLKLFLALEQAEEYGVHYIQSQIQMNPGLTVRPGEREPGVVKVE